MRIGKKLKALRTERKMTLNELAEKSGVQIATLSRMENDAMTGTLDSHISICRALGVSLSDFYHDLESGQKTVFFIKEKEKREPPVRSSKSSIEMLVTKIAGKKMMPLLVRIQKSGRTPVEENKSGTEKFIYALEGRIRAKIGKEEYDLARGDSIYFDASLPHAFFNRGKSEARVLSLLSPPVV